VENFGTFSFRLVFDVALFNGFLEVAQKVILKGIKMKKKITITIETESENSKIEQYVKRFCIENFQKEAKIEIEDEK